MFHPVVSSIKRLPVCLIVVFLLLLILGVGNFAAVGTENSATNLPRKNADKILAENAKKS